MKVLTYLWMTVMLIVLSFRTAWGQNVNFQQDTTEIITLVKTASQLSFKNFQEASKSIQKAIEIAERIQNIPIIFKVYRKAGMIYESNSKLEDAANFYKKSLDLIDQVNDTQKLDIYIDWAIINKKRGKYKVSKDYYDRTLELATKVNDIEMIEFAYNGLGTLHGALGEFDKAVEAYLHSIDIAKKRKNIREEVVGLTNIANVYTKANNFDLALERIQQAKELATQIKDSLEIANVLNIYGKILNAKKDFKKALSYHEEALNIYEMSGDKRHILETLIYLSDLYAEAGAYTTAEFYFKKCFDYKDYFEYYEHPNLYLKLGSLYQKTGKTDESIEALKTSLYLATNRSFRDIIQKSNLGLSQVYKDKGQYKEAFNYLHVANLYSDSLFNEEKSKRLAEAQYKFDVEKSEKEIEALHHKQNRYWFGTIVLFLATLVIALVYFLRLKNRNNKLLLQKNSEIKFQNQRLEKSNEILHQFAYASAHDLKEPLRSISSFVHIIERKYSKLLPPEAGEYMNFVTSGVKRMESLLSALLEYLTVASDEHEVKQTTNLRLALSDVSHNLHRIIAEKNADVEYEGLMPHLWVSRLHLTQLFQNLIGNALKFTNKPPVVRVFSQLKNDELVITIKDNGIGMKQEYSDKIFRLFQRLSRSPQYEGTGIGLAICKHIVDKYNGKIWFESVENEGTTFFIAFPATLIKADTHAEERSHRQDASLTPKS